MGTVHQIRHIKSALQQIHRYINVVEKNLFRHVRPGYAIWHLCVSKKRPVHLDEISQALVEGHVLTKLDEKEIRKATRRLCDYHVTSGKLRRIGGEHYTNRK